VDDTLQLVTFFLFFEGYIVMGAAFVFFMSERNSVAPQYRTTMTISALIVGIAAFHYYYMRGVYADYGEVSIEYRYMDWIITVPLMALKFPSLVGKDAITDEKFLGLGFTGICFTGAIIMIGFGYLGESGAIGGMLGLIIGGVGWVIYPIGYLFNPTAGVSDAVSAEVMAVLYNIADVINKIGFGIVAWMGAKKATEALAAE